MKKVLAFILTAIFAVTAFTAVAETPSPEKLSGVIVSATAKDSKGTSFKVSIKPTEVNQSVYTEAFEALKKEVGTDLKLVDQKQIVLEGSGNPSFPMTVELNVPGVKPTSKVYVLFKSSSGSTEGLSASANEGKVIGLSAPMNFSRVINLAETGSGEVVKLPATAGENKVTVTFNELGEFVLVTDAQTVADITAASKDNTKSPQTSDAATPIVLAMLAVSAIAAIVSVKKFKAAE